MTLYSLNLRGDRWLPPPNSEGPAKLSRQQRLDSLAFGRPEMADRMTYDHATKTWVRSKCQVQVSKGPFDRGFTRLVYHIKTLEPDGTWVQAAAKFLDSKILKPLVGEVTRQMYFDEALSLVVSDKYAKLFNERNPPQQINFCQTYILEFLERPGKPLCSVEPLLEGEFVKHNNNNGGVLSKRMTPQAFSHFTHHVSNGKILVCDIQGCDNTFTDPQIHSADQKGYGLGNQGKAGFDKFFKTHTCGVVCAVVDLPRLEAGARRPSWTREEIIAMLKEHNLAIPPHLAEPDHAPSGTDSPTREELSHVVERAEVDDVRPEQPVADGQMPADQDEDEEVFSPFSPRSYMEGEERVEERTEDLASDLGPLSDAMLSELVVELKQRSAADRKLILEQLKSSGEALGEPARATFSPLKSNAEAEHGSGANSPVLTVMRLELAREREERLAADAEWARKHGEERVRELEARSAALETEVKILRTSLAAKTGTKPGVELGAPTSPGVAARTQVHDNMAALAWQMEKEELVAQNKALQKQVQQERSASAAKLGAQREQHSTELQQLSSHLAQTEQMLTALDKGRNESLMMEISTLKTVHEAEIAALNAELLSADEKATQRATVIAQKQMQKAASDAATRERCLQDMARSAQAEAEAARVELAALKRQPAIALAAAEAAQASSEVARAAAEDKVRALEAQLTAVTANHAAENQEIEPLQRELERALQAEAAAVASYNSLQDEHKAYVAQASEIRRELESQLEATRSLASQSREHLVSLELQIQTESAQQREREADWQATVERLKRERDAAVEAQRAALATAQAHQRQVAAVNEELQSVTGELARYRRKESSAAHAGQDQRDASVEERIESLKRDHRQELKILGLQVARLEAVLQALGNRTLDVQESGKMSDRLASVEAAHATEVAALREEVDQLKQQVAQHTQASIKPPVITSLSMSSYGSPGGQDKELEDLTRKVQATDSRLAALRHQQTVQGVDADSKQELRLLEEKVAITERMVSLLISGPCSSGGPTSPGSPHSAPATVRGETSPDARTKVKPDSRRHGEFSRRQQEAGMQALQQSIDAVQRKLEAERARQQAHDESRRQKAEGEVGRRAMPPASPAQASARSYPDDVSSPKPGSGAASQSKQQPSLGGPEACWRCPAANHSSDTCPRRQQGQQQGQQKPGLSQQPSDKGARPGGSQGKGNGTRLYDAVAEC
mmetsp:Transcript_7809/g.18131  ORF Transcript_7809/g.18131 Transcript_7809/m.18131 type:complete len:1207 (+) Transcript_7809:32-3652(+)